MHAGGSRQQARSAWCTAQQRPGASVVHKMHGFQTGLIKNVVILQYNLVITNMIYNELGVITNFSFGPAEFLIYYV